MSTIASFFKVPKNLVEDLREAIPRTQQPPGTPHDAYNELLHQHGQQMEKYPWSGYFLVTLLVYLQENKQIDLMHSEFDKLSEFLTNSQGTTCFILTEAHKRNYLAKLTGEFSERSLCDYYNQFNDSDDPEAGKLMLDGVRVLRDNLNQLDDSSVIVCSIG